MSPKKLPSRERIAELFQYANGALIRRKPLRGYPVGSRAGSVKSNGYRRVSIDGTTYPEHRVIWLLVNGVEPPEMLDHIDFDRTNNRIENLRPCTASENSTHRVTDKHGRGVTFHSRAKKFQAQIRVNGRNHYLGLFEDMRDASLAYDRAAIEHFGPFAVTNGERA